jgi:hypothetical protein
MIASDFTISLRIGHPTIDRAKISAAPPGFPDIARPGALGARSRHSSPFTAQGAGVESELTRAPVSAPRTSSE